MNTFISATATTSRPPAGLPRTNAHGETIHYARTSVLRAHCDPYLGCWSDLQRPLTLDEVGEVLATQLPAQLPAGPLPAVDKLSAQEYAQRRQLHLARIAWFVHNGFQKPLEVDVGIPALGCWVGHIVTDGNHRLAAAIYRLERMAEDPWLPLSVSGQVSLAKEMGLLHVSAPRTRHRTAR